MIGVNECESNIANLAAEIKKMYLTQQLSAASALPSTTS